MASEDGKELHWTARRHGVAELDEGAFLSDDDDDEVFKRRRALKAVSISDSSDDSSGSSDEDDSDGGGAGTVVRRRKKRPHTGTKAAPNATADADNTSASASGASHLSGNVQAPAVISLDTDAAEVDYNDPAFKTMLETQRLLAAGEEELRRMHSIDCRTNNLDLEAASPTLPIQPELASVDLSRRDDDAAVDELVAQYAARAAEVVSKQTGAAQTAAQPDQPLVTLSFRCPVHPTFAPDTNPFHVRIPLNEPMGNYLGKICSELLKGAPRSQVLFDFDGEPLGDSTVPADEDMEDGMLIDIRFV